MCICVIEREREKEREGIAVVCLFLHIIYNIIQYICISYMCVYVCMDIHICKYI